MAVISLLKRAAPGAWLLLPALFALEVLAQPGPGGKLPPQLPASAADRAQQTAPARTAPSVSLTAPAGGSVFNVPATITLQAQATASSPGREPVQVHFYSGATSLGTASVSPYTLSWSPVAPAIYELTAVATDRLGVSATSAPVAIRINAPPTASLMAPAMGTAGTAPASVTLSAQAADSDGTVAKVDFYASGVHIGTALAAPYVLQWSNVAAGTYSLTAIATDNDGASASSAAVSVRVNAPPQASLTQPAPNSVIHAPATLGVGASAQDNDGAIVKVQFYANGALIGEATQSPYSIAWSEVAAGRYGLTAVATDNDGATATSAAVPIRVNAPPTVSLTSPTNQASFTAPADITLTADAQDADGTIAQVDFYDGTSLIATRTEPPFSILWTAVPPGSYILSAKARDNDGAEAASASLAATVTSSVAKLYFIHVDHLNTPRLVANQGGQTVWRWDQQEPFGINPADENPSGLGTFEFPMRFPGQYADKETNLSQNWMRDYDATIGRYTESDPIGLRGGLNTYAYVGAKPLDYIDPAGLAMWNVIWNGNLLPGYNPQQGGCDVVGALPFFFNQNPCALQCCKEHDNCFAAFACNWSSWGGNLMSWTPNPMGQLFGKLPCPMCNAQAMQCMSKAAFGCVVGLPCNN